MDIDRVIKKFSEASFKVQMRPDFELSYYLSDISKIRVFSAGIEKVQLNMRLLESDCDTVLRTFYSKHTVNIGTACWTDLPEFS